MTTLLALHGFTQNGSQLRTHLQPLLSKLPGLNVECPDGPHTCSEAGVERLARLLGGPSLPPPHRAWWDASDDGRIYRGWEESLARLRALALRDSAVGVLGFSQGAMVAAALAGLAERGEFPALRCAVLVAGRKPRAEALQPLFDGLLSMPSLHVWGERDGLATDSAQLAEHFAAACRETVQWPGPHVLPTHGQAADAIVAFMHKHLG